VLFFFRLMHVEFFFQSCFSVHVCKLLMLHVNPIWTCFLRLLSVCSALKWTLKSSWTFHSCCAEQKDFCSLYPQYSFPLLHKHDVFSGNIFPSHSSLLFYTLYLFYWLFLSVSSVILVFSECQPIFSNLSG